ncbi:MAG TPA: thermonuclease family protein [Pirellulales bacterium]|nr:thermonuclease family protein [Pirellulales bacterium]
MVAPLELDRTILDGELAPSCEIGSLAGLRIASLALAPARSRSFRRLHWRPIAIAFSVLAFVAAQWELSGNDAVVDLPEGNYKVAEVLAADRLELTNHVKVHLLGVEPLDRRTGHDGSNAIAEARSAAALSFTRRLIAEGETRLQFDRTRQDADGSYLAYVWVDGQHGSRMLNEELLRAGLLRMAPKSPCSSSSMKRRLGLAADDARRAGRGLWAKN